VLPYTGRLARILGFQPLPGTFFLALAGIVVVYLVLAEIGLYWFYRLYHAPATPAPRHRTAGYRLRRRAAASSLSTPSGQCTNRPNADPAGPEQSRMNSLRAHQALTGCPLWDLRSYLPTSPVMVSPRSR
jgi:hypothetical protein